MMFIGSLLMLQNVRRFESFVVLRDFKSLESAMGYLVWLMNVERESFSFLSLRARVDILA